MTLFAVEARNVDLDARLGEGEEVRAQLHLALLAEDRARESEQRSLEIRESDPLVHREALELVKLRRVGGVVVEPEHTPRGDHIQRRRRGHHRANLHR